MQDQNKAPSGACDFMQLAQHAFAQARANLERARVLTEMGETYLETARLAAELWVNLGDDGLRGGVSRRVTSLPEPPERSDTPCREIPTFSGSVSLTQSTIP